MKKLVLLILVVALLSMGGMTLAQDGPFRVAIVMPSSITDISWSQAIYDGLVEVQTAMGGEGALEIAYTEGMFDVAAAAETLRGYAEDGYDLVIAHGTQYGTSLFDMAADFPETSFAWGTATDTGVDAGLTNIYAYEASAEEGGYVNGVMAALMTDANVIGVVGPVEAGDALLYINGFIQGVEATNPDVELLVAYTGSFSDVAAGTDVANTHIAAGADVLTGTSQMVVGAIEAIQTEGGYWFGTQSDQSPEWPDAVVVSQVYNWAPVLTDMIERIQGGELGGVAYNLTLENGGQTFVFGNVTIPADVLAAAGEAAAGILSGEITVARELSE
ncbi:MAG: BMP family ABC transporter substrate-binding protein [Anaerolineaceae bacterium]|nr:BMP family ABC transporter substrate-binding protein [Anaerolineaceae bacterium]